VLLRSVRRAARAPHPAPWQQDTAAHVQLRAGTGKGPAVQARCCPTVPSPALQLQGQCRAVCSTSAANICCVINFLRAESAQHLAAFSRCLLLAPVDAPHTRVPVPRHLRRQHPRLSSWWAAFSASCSASPRTSPSAPAKGAQQGVRGLSSRCLNPAELEAPWAVNLKTLRTPIKQNQPPPLKRRDRQLCPCLHHL